MVRHEAHPRLSTDDPASDALVQTPSNVADETGADQRSHIQQPSHSDRPTTSQSAAETPVEQLLASLSLAHSSEEASSFSIKDADGAA